MNNFQMQFFLKQIILNKNFISYIQIYFCVSVKLLFLHYIILTTFIKLYKIYKIIIRLY